MGGSAMAGRGALQIKPHEKLTEVTAQVAEAHPRWMALGRVPWQECHVFAGVTPAALSLQTGCVDEPKGCLPGICWTDRQSVVRLGKGTGRYS